MTNLEIAIKALKEIAEMKYALTHTETEEATIAIKALEQLKE